MVVFKKGRGLLGLVGSLKSAVSQEWINEMSWFFAYFNNYWLAMGKNGQGLIDFGTFESGVSDQWFHELSRLI